MRALLLALVAVLGASCGEQCCGAGIVIGAGKRYVATIPNADGGTPTRVELVLDTRPTYDSPGAARLTFRRGTQEVVETWSAQQR